MKPEITFDIITLFPDVIRPYLDRSIIGRAVKKGIIKIHIQNLRDFTLGSHHKADDCPYGGGPGMVLKLEPLIKAISSLKLKVSAKGRSASGGKSSSHQNKFGTGQAKLKVILFSPAGKQFDNKVAARLAKNYNQLILICGRYEGIDARLMPVFKTLKLSTLELSVGPYVLTGGELPALTIIDAVSRKIKGVLGKEESLEEKRYGVGVPVYTRPETLVYKKKRYRVPKVLLSGNHKDIERWRLEHKPRSEFLTGLRQNSILRNKMPVKNLLRGKKNSRIP